MKDRCKCPVCKHTRKLRIVSAQLDRRGRAMVEELWEMWANADMDSTYWRMKYKGTWPNGAGYSPSKVAE